MSNIDDKARGTGNQAVGKVKEVAGAATGDEQLEAEGEGQQVKGKAQKALGDAKDAVSGALESAADAVKGSGS